MAESFTMTATVINPVRVVSDMSLSLERVIALMANSNSDFMEYVVERLSGGEQSLHRVASNIWCINQVGIEKLEEIQKLLGEAEGPLLRLRNEREG
ncbi:hypothetical protein [Sphingomonas sp. CCH5-D11]|uniref:hypothetical protein n=1 Tax=Sphingomonas sp. CCH5-D11 TaxID=1768786 RepID=UPI00082E17BE|nr:hypothetical protein [Sphingomonas sp. CCH5-D11]